GERLGDDSAVEPFVREVGLVVVEGEPDWWTWATRWGEAHDLAPAVLGLVSGSWTEEIAARVPDGTSVVVRTHADRPGGGYAERVVRSPEGRGNVLRPEVSS